MQLTSQHLAEIVGALKKLEQAGGHEKRRATRMSVQANVSVSTVVGGNIDRTFEAMTRDISSQGIGLMQSLQMMSGQQFVVAFPREDRATLRFRIVTRHCRQLANGIYGIGGEFEEMIPDKMFEAMNNSPEAQMRRIQASILG